MTWFKVDDGLPDHRKTRAVRRTHPAKRRDASPMGIWVLAGAWSDDGFVPTEVLLDWDDDAETLAARLVAAGFWWETEQGGEPGYGFHDWQDYLPRPDGIPADASESGRRGNHVRWHEGRGIVDPACEFCRPDHRGDVGAIDRGDAENLSGANREPVPSRPVPTRPEDTPRSRSATDSPDRFEEFWAAYDHKVGRKKAETAYRAALKKPGVTEDLLITAAGEYVTWMKSEGKHPQFTKHPTTWLHGEHWTDERVTRQVPQSNTQRHLALARQLAEADPTLPQIGGPS